MSSTHTWAVWPTIPQAFLAAAELQLRWSRVMDEELVDWLNTVGPCHRTSFRTHAHALWFVLTAFAQRLLAIPTPSVSLSVA